MTEYTRPNETDPLPKNVITLYDTVGVVKYYDLMTGQEVPSDKLIEGGKYKEVTVQQAVPKYYTAELKQVEYGDKDSAAGAPEIFDIKVPGADGMESTLEYEIKYYVNNDRLAPDKITGNQNGADINYDFVGFEGESQGVIYNHGNYSETYKIGNITGDFVGNSNISTTGGGGAISNTNAIIGDITGSFIGNYTTGLGGAIHNYGGSYGGASTAIGNITGDFIGNYSDDYGGAIGNAQATIGNITGNFIGNYTSSRYGGAIYGGYGSVINRITGDFIGNNVTSPSGGYGGAIYNSGSITDITGDFIKNSSNCTGTYLALGGAIYNNGEIGKISGNFINNTTTSSSNRVAGGAIYNSSGKVGDITGNFIGNSIATQNSTTIGAGIFNTGTMGNITGDFINNHAAGGQVSGSSIAIDISGTVNDITGNFINNTIEANEIARGTILVNGSAGNITGNFINNTAIVSSDTTRTLVGGGGSAIFLNDATSSSVNDIAGNFINNSTTVNAHDEVFVVQSYGGAVHITGTAGNITGDFIGNYLESYIDDNSQLQSAFINGGAVSTVSGKIGEISGDFISNHVYSNIDPSKSDTGIPPSTQIAGGAIANTGTIGSYEDEDNTFQFVYQEVSIVNSETKETYTVNQMAVGTQEIEQALAEGKKLLPQVTKLSQELNAEMYESYVQMFKEQIESGNSSVSDISIYDRYAPEDFAQLKDGITNSSFYDNYIEAPNASAQGGAIYTATDFLIIAKDGYTSVFDGNYVLDKGGKREEAIYVDGAQLTLRALNNGSFIFNDGIDGFNGYRLNLTGDNTGSVGLYNYVNKANVTTDNITVDFANGEIRNYDLTSFKAGENSKLNLDVDFINGTADTITTQNNSTGTLVINTINEIGSAAGAVTIQIIKNTDTSSTFQLALGDNITSVLKPLDFNQDTVNNTDIFMQEGGLALSTTTTTNDTLTIVQDKLFDTLQLINERESEAERTFQFVDTSNYNLSEDLTPTAEGVLNINGLGETAQSTLDAKNHTMFDLQNATTLNINNTEIKNAKDFAINIANENAAANLTNAAISGTNTGSDDNLSNLGAAVNNQAVLNVQNTTFSGNLGGAIYNEGALTIANSTFNDNTATSGGALHLSSSVPEFDVSGGIGVFYGYDIYNVSNPDKSYTFIVTGDEDIKNIYNGSNFVIIPKIPVYSDEAVDDYAQMYEQLFQSGEAEEDGIYREISDLPVSDTPHIKGTEAKEFMLGLLSNIVEPITYKGEVLRTYYNAEAMLEISFGLYNPKAVGNNIEYEISNTVFSGNSAENASGSALGGAIYVEAGKSLTMQDVADDLIEEMVTSPELYGMIGQDVSDDFATKEEAIAALDKSEATPGFWLDSGYTKNPEGVFSDEYVIKSGTPKVNVINSSFLDNRAISKSGEAKGGAVYTAGDLSLTAKDGYTSTISGNYVEDKNGKRPEAVYMASSDSVLDINANTKGKFVIDDQINGADGYKLNFSGDNTGTVQLNNNIKGKADIDLKDITLHLSTRDDVLNGNNFTANSGALNMINGQVGAAALSSFTVNGNTDMYADVDLANKTMDRITSDNYGEHSGNINVAGVNLISDANEQKTEILFADAGLKDNVTTGITSTDNNPHQLTAYTPLYKYNVEYDNREDAGYMLFFRGDPAKVPGGTGGGTTGGGSTGGNPSSMFNPSVLTAPVASQAGAYAAQNAAFSYAFAHADSFMPLPSAERFAMRSSNQYAVTSYNSLSMQMNDLHRAGIWVRPYASFESIQLKNGPDVDTTSYGTLVGGDSSFKELRNGWGTVFTGYAGYNGSSQHYNGVNTYQNGGLLGATQTFYKGNFFTALTASVGASAGESHNMYGKDDFAMLMAGVASKSGYNLEFKEGKYIIQPSLQLAYTFINTFDYRTAGGVHIDSDPLHAIQINPNIKFIGNFKNGWQPYASVGMVWNVMDDTNVRANNVQLPEMSVKPYVEYGVGVQKRWKDKCTGYVQAMVRNGGRTGVALSAGFRWAIGKDSSDKTVESTSVKKVLKARDTKIAVN